MRTIFARKIRLEFYMQVGIIRLGCIVNLCYTDIKDCTPGKPPAVGCREDMIVHDQGTATFEGQSSLSPLDRPLITKPIRSF